MSPWRQPSCTKSSGGSRWISSEELIHLRRGLRKCAYNREPGQALGLGAAPRLFSVVSVRIRIDAEADGASRQSTAPQTLDPIRSLLGAMVAWFSAPPYS